MTTLQPTQTDILRMIDRDPNLQPSTKKQYKKAIRGYLDTGNSLSDANAIDILLGQQSFFNGQRRALFWPAETGTEQDSGRNWVSVVVVWLISVLVFDLIYLSEK
jgi:hypothetical protein